MVGHFIGIRVLLLWGVVLCKWVQRLPWFNLGLDQLFLGPFGCGEGWYVNVHLSCDPISGKPPAHPNKNVQPSAFLPHKKVFIRIELASVCRYQSGEDQQYLGNIEWQRWHLQWLLACPDIVDVNPIPLTFFSGFVSIISDQHNFGVRKLHILMILKKIWDLKSTCTLHIGWVMQPSLFTPHCKLRVLLMLSLLAGWLATLFVFALLHFHFILVGVFMYSTQWPMMFTWENANMSFAYMRWGIILNKAMPFTIIPSVYRSPSNITLATTLSRKQALDFFQKFTVSAKAGPVLFSSTPARCGGESQPQSPTLRLVGRAFV